MQQSALVLCQSTISYKRFSDSANKAVESDACIPLKILLAIPDDKTKLKVMIKYLSEL